ncbi:unnamed protein product [Linum trigynum]|uniref:RNase H type-1 domain-containing protein n=1 Tax=Linum trigynum TaxID=586398 RepID=A0AAV2FB86_9ROSI
MQEGGTPSRSVQPLYWRKPSRGWVCLNTDGSVVGGMGSTAAGGVFRNDEGQFLKAFAVNLGRGSVTHAELAGIVQGLRLAWETGYNRIEVHTDSSTAVKLIQTAADHNPHRGLIAAARQLLSLDWQVRITHVFREENFVADYLASEGHSLSLGVHVFENPSPMLRYWLYFDNAGIETPRLINS